MDFCRNVSVSGGMPSEYPPEHVGSLTDSLDDLFSAQNTEVDVSLEWLSIFVEDCFSSTGHSLPTGTSVAAATPPMSSDKNTNQEPSKRLHLQHNSKPLHENHFQKLVFPSKARTKRRKNTATTTTTTTPVNNNKKNKTCWVSSDPPLLQQAYWLADSELIVPPKTEDISLVPLKDYEAPKEEIKIESDDEKEDGEMAMEGNGGGQGRRCTHCLSQKTPQWRAGPLGPKTLCNACGVRYKSGRLLPEYRPAKSPTFVSYLHSNSHKKVLEMRMGPP